MAPESPRSPTEPEPQVQRPAPDRGGGAQLAGLAEPAPSEEAAP